MLEFNDAHGPNAIKEEKNYLLMFYTDWCPYCPPLIKALDELQKRDGGFELAIIKHDDNPEAVHFFGASGVPFVFAIKEKAVLAGWGGLIDIDAYEKIVAIAFHPKGKKLSQADLDSLVAIGKAGKIA